MQTCGTNFLLIQEADDLEIILNYREVIRIYSFSGIISFSKKKIRIFAMKLIKQRTTRLSAIIILSLSDTVFGRKASNAKIFVLHLWIL